VQVFDLVKISLVVFIQKDVVVAEVVVAALDAEVEHESGT
jgi:hypothetical protein